MSKFSPQINPKYLIAALSTGAALVLSAATSRKTTTDATGVIKKRDLLLK